MKNKILKLITVLVLLTTLTMINFIYVGVGLISFAVSSMETNHQNVEFDARLKDNSILELEINVKKEGYFNGEITLENSGFELKSVKNQYVNKIEGNTIKLNQLNAEDNIKIEIEVEPIRKEIMDVGLLNEETKVILTGKYKDRTEKDITIKAEREVKIEYATDITEKDVSNDLKVITNKIIEISGKEKRVVQIELNMGLNANNYPIKEMKAELTVPKIDGKSPEVVKNITFNTMTHYDYHYNGEKIELTFENNPNEQNKILWRKEGTEKAVFTLIYDKEANAEGSAVELKENVKLYNDKNIDVTNKAEITNIETDGLVQITTKPEETTIYKGKLNSGIDREYKTTTTLQVNLANVEGPVTLSENSSLQSGVSNIVYSKTSISKEQFDEILGQTGTITVKDENGKVIGTLTSSSSMDEKQNLNIDYKGNEPKAITIETSEPIKEGNLELIHTKIIKEHSEDIVKSATEITENVECAYKTIKNNSNSKIELKEAKTEMTLEVNKSTLSTVIANNVEMRVVLNTSSEEYDLYKNPTITLKLPEEVENIKINSVELLYETELKHEARVEGKNIIIDLKGEQTSYKDAGIEGAILIINADLVVDRKVPTVSTEIAMEYANNGVTGKDSKAMKIIAPKDITAIQNIKELAIETLGQDEEIKVKLEKGQPAKVLETEIEIINSNENTIKDVSILGTFPTKGSINNIDAKVVEGISLQKNSKIYYSENEDATSNLEDSESNWKTEITDAGKVKKYLIKIDEMQAKESIVAKYKVEIPEMLENNKIAKQGYTLEATNTLTNSKIEAKATTITMQTGIGAMLSAKLSQNVGVSNLEENSVVKSGEIIKYKVEVSNEGSEELTNVKVEGNVPEGTKLVVPEEYYEYIGEPYYKELDNKTYETIIGKIKPGEVVIVEYEVKVNNDLQAGTQIQNVSKVTYGETTKTTNETKLVSENANLKVTVKRITDRNVELYESGDIQYFAIIENISNQAQKDVKVKTNMPSGLSVSRLTLLTGVGRQEAPNGNVVTELGNNIETLPANENEIQEIENSEISTQNLEYKEEIDIGTLEAGQTKVLNYDLAINQLDNANKINFSVEALQGNNTYRSNVVTDTVKSVDIGISMTSNVETRYVKEGDKIVYTIEVSNNTSEKIEGIVVKDKIPESLSVEKVSFDGQEVKELENQNNIELTCSVAAKAHATIVIETIINYLPEREEAEVITNVATAEMWGETLATTEKITHIIEEKKIGGNGSTNTEDPNGENGNGQGNSDNNASTQPGDIATGSRMISGMVWLDEDKNGKKDVNEKLLNDVKVRLLNTKTSNLVKDRNGNTLEARTNDDGVYVFSNLQEGEYIAIFDYDTTRYTVTTYKASGVENSKNSKAIIKEVQIGAEKQNIASTDIITINDENIDNINLGLKIMDRFELKLEKFVSKIVLQNAKGTTIAEYDNETLAKKEISRRQVEGTTALIEYTIKVTNVGEVDGYVRKIADYAPSDLKFSSELNNDWYQTGGALYNSSLANDKLTAGDSREVKLTLTKAMNKENTGLINNTAEIVESYNDFGIADSSSTPGNRADSELDFGSADVLLTVGTGGMVYAGIVIVVIAVLAGAGYVIYKKKILIEKKNI